jgi:WD40 repeat protein
VAVWDLEAGSRIHTLTGHQGRVTSVAVSPDGRRIILGLSDATVAVWDLDSSTRVLRLTGHQDGVNSAAVSPDGRRIVSGSDDQTVAVWDLETGQCLTSLTLDGRVRGVAWDWDGHFVGAGDTRGNLYCLEYREP